uniref:Uncharacterized protein n=1 Tax=Syphacia muris TaxID=451379 RepID=A0A0N5AC33_9BILA
MSQLGTVTVKLDDDNDVTLTTSAKQCQRDSSGENNAEGYRDVRRELCQRCLRLILRKLSTYFIDRLNCLANFCCHLFIWLKLKLKL